MNDETIIDLIGQIAALPEEAAHEALREYETIRGQNLSVMAMFLIGDVIRQEKRLTNDNRRNHAQSV